MARGTENFVELNHIVKCNVPGAVLVNDAYHPADGSFIDASENTNICFHVNLGAVADALTFKVVQDKSATATADIKDVAGATATIAGTDDNKQVVIEVQPQRIDGMNGFRYIALQVTGVAGTNNAAITAVMAGSKDVPTTWTDLAVDPVIAAN